MPRPRKTQFGLAYFCARSSLCSHTHTSCLQIAFVQARLTRLERRHGRAQIFCRSAAARIVAPPSYLSLPAVQRSGAICRSFIELRRNSRSAVTLSPATK